MFGYFSFFFPFIAIKCIKNIYCLDIFTHLFCLSPSNSTDSGLPVLLNLHCIKTWSSHIFFQYFFIVHELDMFQRIRMKAEKKHD